MANGKMADDGSLGEGGEINSLTDEAIKIEKLKKRQVKRDTKMAVAADTEDHVTITALKDPEDKDCLPRVIPTHRERAQLYVTKFLLIMVAVIVGVALTSPFMFPLRIIFLILSFSDCGLAFNQK